MGGSNLLPEICSIFSLIRRAVRSTRSGCGDGMSLGAHLQPLSLLKSIPPLP